MRRRSFAATQEDSRVAQAKVAERLGLESAERQAAMREVYGRITAALAPDDGDDDGADGDEAPAACAERGIALLGEVAAEVSDRIDCAVLGAAWAAAEALVPAAEGAEPPASAAALLVAAVDAAAQVASAHVEITRKLAEGFLLSTADPESSLDPSAEALGAQATKLRDGTGALSDAVLGLAELFVARGGAAAGDAQATVYLEAQAAAARMVQACSKLAAVMKLLLMTT